MFTVALKYAEAVSLTDDRGVDDRNLISLTDTERKCISCGAAMIGHLLSERFALEIPAVAHRRHIFDLRRSVCFDLISGIAVSFRPPDFDRAFSPDERPA